jgi:hypothetical protein
MKRQRLAVKWAKEMSTSHGTAARRISLKHSKKFSETFDVIPMQVRTEQRALLLRHPAYKKRDVVDLFIEAKAYVQRRIPVPDKETAIAFLLSRDAALSSRTLRAGG